MSLLISLLFYFLPWFIALLKKHKSTDTIFVLNLLLGWTGIGWLVLLIWAAIK